MAASAITLSPGGGFLLEPTGSATIFTPEMLNDEQRMMKKTADDFMRGEVLPRLDGDKSSASLIAESVAMQGSFAVSFGAHVGIGTMPIALFGTPTQRQKYLPGLATGEM